MKQKLKNHLRILKKGSLKVLFFILCSLIYGSIFSWIVLKNFSEFNFWESMGVLNFIFGFGVCISLIISTYGYLEPRIFKQGIRISLVSACVIFLIFCAFFALLAVLSQPFFFWFN